MNDTNDLKIWISVTQRTHTLTVVGVIDMLKLSWNVACIRTVLLFPFNTISMIVFLVTITYLVHLSVISYFYIPIFG